jgi:hypothetical protein
MNLFITQADTGHQQSDMIDDHLHYLPHEKEPVDFYRKYKDDNYVPTIGRRGVRNLFDDLDVKDYYWFRRAREYLRKN